MTLYGSVTDALILLKVIRTQPKSLEGLADRLSCHPRTVRRLIAAIRLAGVRIDEHRATPRAAIHYSWPGTL